MRAAGEALRWRLQAQGSRPYEAVGTFRLPRPVIYQIPAFRTLCQARAVRTRDGTAASVTTGRVFQTKNLAIRTNEHARIATS
jgi:hypothetical protein